MNKKIIALFGVFILIIFINLIFFQNCKNFQADKFSYLSKLKIPLDVCSDAISINLKYFCQPEIKEESENLMQWKLHQDNTCSWIEINQGDNFFSGIPGPDDIGDCEFVIENIENLNTISKKIKVLDIIKLKIDLTPQYARFGQCISVYKDTAFIGRYKPSAYDEVLEEKYNVYTYVFKEKELGIWEKVQELSFPDELLGEADDFIYGSCSLDSSENLLAIGAPYQNNIKGALYLFNKTNDNWNFYEKIIPEDVDDSDVFGENISIYDDTMVVSAQGKNSKDLVSKGSVYIYKKKNYNTWEKVNELIPLVDLSYNFGGTLSFLPNNDDKWIYSDAKWINTDDLILADLQDRFGLDVSLYEKKLLVKARGDFVSIDDYKSLLYLFEEKEDNKWELIKLFAHSDSYDLKNVLTSEIHSYKNTFMLSLKNSLRSGELSNIAYIISKNEQNEWILQKLIVNKVIGQGYNLNTKLLNETTALVAVYDHDYHDNRDTSFVDKVYIFKLINNVWQQYTEISHPEQKTNVMLGYSIDTFENKILISAPTEKINDSIKTGALYVYYY